MCVNWLFILLVRLVNSRLLVVRFWESQKFYVDFLLHGGLAPLTPWLFKGQLYCVSVSKRCCQMTINVHLKKRNLFSHSSGHQKCAIKGPAGPCSQKPLQETLPCLFPLLVVPGVPWSVAAELQPPPSSSHALPRTASVFLCPFSDKYISHWI